MHCADICLSATHNESARKLVMTQFEPCQYRHKSRYASVLQNRCFYTYIWLAYLVRFFERLLRQTTPKLLPLFECLPLLFLLMSLRYSERPNISFLAGTFLMGSKVWAEGISINYQQQINFSSGEVSGNFVDYRFNASNISSLYQNDLTEVRVNALFGMNLIRAF